MPRTLSPTGRCSDRIESRARLPHEHSARFGESDAASVPIEEFHPETLFELMYRSGQRGLSDAERLGGPSEVKFAGDGGEIPQLTRLDIDHLLTLRP